MKNSVKSLAIGALVVGSLVVAPVAFAADVTQTVTAGTRTASVADVTLGAVVTSHSGSSAAGTLNLIADDTTGSGAGWQVSQKVSAFDPTAAMVTAGATAIPAAGFTATVGTVTSTAGQAATGVTATSGAITLDTEKVVLSAAAKNGMGTYTAPVALGLTIPADTYAGDYLGVLTTTIAAAPVV